MRRRFEAVKRAGLQATKTSNRLDKICRDGRVVDCGGLVRSVSDGIANL